MERRSMDDAGDLPRPCGAYTLKSVLGAGGMAIVYRAQHTLLGQEVAIKMIREEFATEPQVVAFFGSELQALVRIRHPNVVEVQNVFESEQGEKCLVMELLEARSLRQVLEKKEPLLFQDVLHLAHQVASALQAAHAAGVIHRDLKPDNVAVLQRSGIDEQRLFVKVLDFGVARLKSEQRDREQIVGTLAYIAPELLRGAQADARSDAYAFGVLLYELLAGTLPFDPGSEKELLSRGPVVPLSRLRPDLPVEVLELVASCIAEEPMMRPASMLEVANVLERLRTRQATYVHTSWYATQRRSVAPFVFGAFLLVAVVLVAWWWKTRPPVVVALPRPVAAQPVADGDPPLVPLGKARKHKAHVVAAPAAVSGVVAPTATVPVVQNLDEKEPLDDPNGEELGDEDP